MIALLLVVGAGGVIATALLHLRRVRHARPLRHSKKAALAGKPLACDACMIDHRLATFARIASDTG